MKHAVLALLAAVNSAHADELATTRETRLFEVSHAVDVRIADGVAIYKVQRQFANPSLVAEEAQLSIDLPYGAAATGLRIRARNRWFDGELMERDKAAALYKQMTGFGAFQPKDPALLQWQWADKLHLQVFPVLPGQVSTVEYTLTVPTRYEGGRYWISYPRVVAGRNAKATSRELALPTITVNPSWGDSQTPITIDGKRVAAGTPFVLSPPIHPPWQELVDTEPNASYVASEIAIPSSSHTTKVINTATVTLHINHTYKGDLRIGLLTPQGKPVTLQNQKGGGDNNVSGKFPVSLPPGTTGAGTWRLVVSDHAALDTGTLDSWSIAFGAKADATAATAADTPVFIPDAPETGNDAGVAAISIAPPDLHTWTARLGKVVASPQHAFARLEVDVAPQLSELPKQAQIAFVVDASYSVGAQHLAAQLDVIRAYLSHVPDAQVEFIAVRRRASRVFNKFVPVKTALAALATPVAFALGNGSAIDDGAKLAAAALADRSGPRRVVFTTDQMFRSSLRPDAALAALAPLSKDTVVHLVAPIPDGDDRIDMPRIETEFSPLATHHHGIHVELRGVPAKTAKDLTPVVLELVRPTKIEHLKVVGMPVTTEILHEGDGLRIFEPSKRAPDKVTLAGTMWSDPVAKEVVPTVAFSRSTAAFVFGADEHHELSHDEMMTVAMLGRAVSPVTSYVAAEPGTRPSTIGLIETMGHGSGSGYGSGYGRSGGVTHRLVRPRFEDLIDSTACEKTVKPAPRWSVALDIETTKHEIVDVVAPSPDPMTACLIEATWNLRLDPAAFSHDREMFHVVLRGR